MDSPFDDFVNRLIPKHIPAVFLEGYKAIVKQTDELLWPQNPKVIYTSNVLWHDSVSMAYTAEKTENGAGLLYGQHGGFYGSALYSWAERHEIEISDKYLTWGWDELLQPKIIPTGVLKTASWYNNAVDLKKNKTKKLLLVLVSTSM